MTFTFSVSEIDHESYCHPHKEYEPAFRRNFYHEVKTEGHTKNRNERQLLDCGERNDGGSENDEDEE